jgi:hypothetical protein
MRKRWVLLALLLLCATLTLPAAPEAEPLLQFHQVGSAE